MRLIRFGLAALLGLLLAPLPAPAQDSFLPMVKEGQVYEYTLTLPHLVLALPPGGWTLVSANESLNSTKDVTVLDLTLAQIERGTLAEFLTVTTNVGPNARGWLPYKDCDRKDVYYSEKIANDANRQDCRWINHIVYDSISYYAPAVGRNIQSYAREKRVAFPPTTLMKAVRLANKTTFLTVQHHINPAMLDINDAPTTWADSPWHPAVVLSDPVRLDILRSTETDLARWYARIKDDNHF